MIDYSESIQKKISPLVTQITHHPVYTKLTSPDNFRFFMEQHVFAVWDFMCLLKELYRSVVCTSSPWFPPKDALSANLIGGILVEEEGDMAENKDDYISHYELYLQAMKNIGASTKNINLLLSLLKNGESIDNAINTLHILPTTKNFVLTTFNFFNKESHELAAAFVYGREGITSPMFIAIVEQLTSNVSQTHKKQFSTLIYYLNRHIELDSAEHFPKAIKMLCCLAQQNHLKWQQIENTAINALEARIGFLSGIANALPSEVLA